jgi:type III pantothenate kinase
MRLLIDAGNSRIKWAVAGAQVDSVIEHGVIVDDWSVLIEYVGKLDSAWLSCVASEQIRNAISSQVDDLFGFKPHVVAVTASVAGMVNVYQDLDKLGVDRWVAALGGRWLVSQGDLIIIDAGTAVTIDLVSAKNRFEGGVILPGFAIMHDALLGSTAGIQSQPAEAGSVIGKNTQECVNAGVQFGLLGAIERIVAELCSVIGAQQSNSGSMAKVPRLLIMGGDAAKIVAGSDLDLELQSHMIFYGLMLLSKT